MLKKIGAGLKGVRRFMEKKIEACKEILGNRGNRIVIGMIATGLSVGLMISGYMPLPN